MQTKKNALPNLFTLGNLSCGVMSIMMTFQDNLKSACFFILLAALMDRYDGRVARLLNVSSELGKQLDSLADLVSFGVAPSILIFNMYNFSNFGLLGYLLVLLFPLAGAYRLARYNITTFDGDFSGIPITLAGAFMAIYGLLTINNTSNYNIAILFTVSLSYLMISKFKFKKF